MEYKSKCESFSSLSTYAKCPYFYYQRKVKKVKASAPDFTGAAPGNVAHRLVDRFIKSKDYNFDKFFDDFSSIFKKEMSSRAVHLGPKAFAKDLKDAYAKIHLWTENLVDMIKFNNLIQPFMISESTAFRSWRNPLKISDTFSFTGGFDLFTSEHESKPGRLIDWKASDSTFHIDERQLLLYVVASKLKLHLKVSMAGFFLFKGRKIHWVHPSESKLSAAIDWAESCIFGINSGKFDPTPAKASCFLCDYRSQCEYSFKFVDKSSAIFNVSQLSENPIDSNIFEEPPVL